MTTSKSGEYDQIIFTCLFSRLLLFCTILTNIGVGVGAVEPKSMLRRRVELDRARWIFDKWDLPALPQSNAGEKPEPGLLVKDVMRKLTSDVQFEHLEICFADRLRKNAELLEFIYPFEVSEKRRELFEKGLSSRAVDAFAKLPIEFEPPSEDECLHALSKYTRAQDAAELAWFEILEEVLLPNQLDALASQFMNIRRGPVNIFSTQFASLYLKLSKQQTIDMQKRCSAAQVEVEKLKPEIGKSRSRKELQQFESRFVSTHQEFRRAYFSPYAVLTVSQFRQFAVVSELKAATQTWEEFYVSVQSKDDAYKNVLGPLVEEVINLEKSNKR